MTFYLDEKHRDITSTAELAYPVTWAGRLFMFGVAVVFIAFPAFLAFRVYNEYQDAERWRDTGTTSAFIQTCEQVDAEGSNATGRHPRITYSYSVDGVTYTDVETLRRSDQCWWYAEGTSMELEYRLADHGDSRIAGNVDDPDVFAWVVLLFLAGWGILAGIIIVVVGVFELFDAYQHWRIRRSGVILRGVLDEVKTTYDIKEKVYTAKLTYRYLTPDGRTVTGHAEMKRGHPRAFPARRSRVKIAYADDHAVILL